MRGSASSSWPSPKASEAGPDFAKADRSSTGLALPAAAALQRLWLSPSAGDERAGPPETQRQPMLANQARMWLTPDVPNGGRTLDAGATRTGRTPKGKKQQVGLENQAKLWTTPQSRDWRSGETSDATAASNARPLSEQAARWKTPRVSRGSYTRDKGNPDSPRLTLEGEAAMFFPVSSRQDQTNSPHGPSSFSTPRSLNPRFVEALMGWPFGWTDFACSATGLSHWSLHMRFELCLLDSPAEVPAQLSFIA